MLSLIPKTIQSRTRPLSPLISYAKNDHMSYTYDKIRKKPSYVLIKKPDLSSTISQSSDLIYKNLIQDIIFQIFNNYSEVPNKLLLDKEFINSISIQISQKIYEDFTKKILKDSDFLKNFTEQIYQDIKNKLNEVKSEKPQ